MSIERELIKDMKILLECTSMGGLQRNADVLIGRAIELLAQPEQEQEPVAWKETIIELFQSVFDSEMLCTAEGEALIRLEDAICYVEELVIPTHDQPEQKQEPVAWFYERQIEGFTERTMSVGFEENFDGVTIPLYLTPPVREPNKDMTLFCVTAYRWGDREKHSYVVGVFDDLERAIHYAKAEREYRGKYECEVISMPLNASKQNRQHKVEYKIDGGVEYELQ